MVRTRAESSLKRSNQTSLVFKPVTLTPVVRTCDPGFEFPSLVGLARVGWGQAGPGRVWRRAIAGGPSDDAIFEIGTRLDEGMMDRIGRGWISFPRMNNRLPWGVYWASEISVPHRGFHLQ